MNHVKCGWVTIASLIVVALAACALTGCQPAFAPADAPEEAARSVEDLLADLDAIGASPSRSLLPAAAIPKPDGTTFAAGELEAYLNAIKVELAGFIAASSAEKPFLVMPVRLRAGGESGLMWVPVRFGRVVSAPVIGFHHGTQTYWKSAPSRYDPNPLSILSAYDVAGSFQNYVECVTAALMASAGYIVVMPDYPGFGDSRLPHPYVHLSLGDATAKMIARAEQVLASPFAAARPNGRIYLTGYSEGGFATMAAAQRLQALGRQVRAAVPCAGSYDMAGTMVADILSGTEAVVPFYVPYTVRGYASVYGAAEPAVWNYSSLLVPPLPPLLDAMFGGEYTSAMISSVIPSRKPLELLTAGLAADLAGYGPVWNRLRENTVFMTGWIPNMLVQMVHCPVDDVVPAANAVAMKAAYAPLPNVRDPIWVPPVPLPDGLADLASAHMMAFPTAMLAAFSVIDAVDAMP